jgi:hypothetical protein
LIPLEIKKKEEREMERITKGEGRILETFVDCCRLSLSVKTDLSSDLPKCRHSKQVQNN